LASVGLPWIALNSAQLSPAVRQRASAACTIGNAASPGSVTSSGALIPSSRQASASSAMRPAPQRIAVG